MASCKDEQEVTVEVVPQTVTEIVYLAESNYYIPSEEEPEEEDSASYEIGSVDSAQLQHMPLMLDESQSFVLLPQHENIFNVKVGVVNEEPLLAPNLYPYEKCHSEKLLSCHKLLTADQHSACVCKVCGLKFNRAQALSHHFRSCHQPPKFVCSICGCPCAHNTALLSHYKKHEPKQFSCDACSSEYNTTVDLLNHKKTHNTDLYACNKCDASFASIAEVSAHLRSMHAKPRAVQSLNGCSSFYLSSPVNHSESVRAPVDDPNEILTYSPMSKRRKK